MVSQENSTDKASASKPEPDKTSTQSQASDKTKAGQNAQSAKNAKPVKNVRAPKPVLKLHLVPWLLLLIVLAAGGYVGWNGWLQWQAFNTVVSSQQSQIADLKGEIQSLAGQEQRIGSLLQQTQRSTDQSVETLRNELIATARRLTESQGVTRYEWLLAEAEYLMRLAQQRLRIEQDAQGALAILQSADAVLRDTQDAGLLDVREALAIEMSQLAQVPSADLSGTYLALMAISREIGSWDYAAEYQAETVGESDQEKAWYQRFEQFIRIQQLDSSFQRPLTPDQHQVLRDVIQLKLEQAQAALMQQNEVVYRAALEQTLNWLEQYAAYQPKAIALAEQIQSVSNLALQQDLPEIGTALKLLKGYITEVYRLQKDESSAREGEENPS